MFSNSNSNSNARDLGRKKRARFAKLKQSKLDVRRQQWLSQGAVKNKEFKEKSNIAGAQIEENLKNDESISINIHLSDSPSNSFTSSNECGTNFAESSCNSSNLSISECYSWSVTEEEDEEENEDCLDDWEAMADALAAMDEQKNPEPVGELIPLSNREDEPGFRAWRHDDALRPQNLPKLSKSYGDEGASRGNNSNISATGYVPSSCPICYEDLDFTDSCFLPCLCGFRLCLFCHNRILEEDGRCPAVGSFINASMSRLKLVFMAVASHFHWLDNGMVDVSIWFCFWKLNFLLFYR